MFYYETRLKGSSSPLAWLTILRMRFVLKISNALIYSIDSFGSIGSIDSFDSIDSID